MISYLSPREAINDAIYLFGQNGTTILQQRRISSIPLHNPIQTSGCNAANNNACPAWQLYQPFILHTADDSSYAYIGGNSSNAAQPSHAIAFRTVDLTDPNPSAAPFAGTGQNTYGGGKLGIYGYWNTCNNNGPSISNSNAPIKMINNSTTDSLNQYEFYNYSLHPNAVGLNANPQEVGNQYFDSNGNATTEALQYLHDFLNNSQTCLATQGCLNIQDELYFRKRPRITGASQGPIREIGP